VDPQADDARTDRPALAVPRWLARSSAIAWRLLAVGAVVYFGWELVGHLAAIVLPFVLAVFISAGLSSSVDRLERHKVPRWLGALLVLFGVFCVVAGAVTLFVIGAANMDSLRDNLRSGWGKLAEGIASTIPMVGRAELRDWVTDAVDGAGQTLQQDLGSMMQGMLTVTAVIAGMAIAFVIAFFLLKDGHRLAGTWLGYLDARRARAVRRIGGTTWHKIGAYVRGVGVIAVFNACATGLAMWLIGIPMVGPVMGVTFVGSFIPFVGPTVAGAMSALIALASGGIAPALGIVGACVAIQAFEGNVLQPVVVGRAVELHPIVVLLAVGVGGAVAGIVGAVVAMPLAASAVSLLREAAAARREEAEGAERDRAPGSTDVSTHPDSPPPGSAQPHGS